MSDDKKPPSASRPWWFPDDWSWDKSSKKNNTPSDNWRKHDIYHPGVSANRIVTRSQTAFLQIKNTPSDLDLFADASRHQPPDQPHLMDTMKGTYGAIPRTIITRSTGKYIPVSDDLTKKMDVYKKYKPPKEEEK